MTEEQTTQNENTEQDAGQNTGQKTEKPFDEFMTHQRTAISELGKAVEALLPPEFREHADNAVNESIKGFAVLVNAVSDEFMNAKSSGDAAQQPTNGGQKVKVEVN